MFLHSSWGGCACTYFVWLSEMSNENRLYISGSLSCSCVIFLAFGYELWKHLKSTVYMKREPHFLVFNTQAIILFFWRKWSKYYFVIYNQVGSFSSSTSYCHGTKKSCAHVPILIWVEHSCITVAAVAKCVTVLVTSEMHSLAYLGGFLVWETSDIV